MDDIIIHRPLSGTEQAAFDLFCKIGIETITALKAAMLVEKIDRTPEERSLISYCWGCLIEDIDF